MESHGASCPGGILFLYGPNRQAAHKLRYVFREDGQGGSRRGDDFALKPCSLRTPFLVKGTSRWQYFHVPASSGPQSARFSAVHCRFLRL